MAAVNSYYTSPEFREIKRLREKARHDEAQALHHAKLEGAAERNIEIAQNLLKIDLPLDQIAKVTGLSQEEVMRLAPQKLSGQEL